MDLNQVRGHPSPLPEGASNLQTVLRHTGVVSAQSWLTDEHLCVGVANTLAEELEPLLIAKLLLRVQEAFGRYISLHSARSACGLMMMMSFICSCRNKNQPKAIYPNGTSHDTSLFRGPSTNDMKK
jgi:hypothetical protein